MAWTINNGKLYFNTKLYTGNGGTNAQTGVGFQPDLIWIKSRSNTEPHIWTDVVRGANKNIRSNATSSEFTDANNITSFNSDGFSLGTGGAVNENTYTFASWNWKAGTSFTNDASATGIGTIDSAGSFNNDSGFSIVSYTGTGSNGTIKHGLNTAPSMVITKSTGAAAGWGVYHQSLGNTNALFLEESTATSASSVYWNNTSPTSSVFSVGSAGAMNNTNGMIAYCFAEKQGYSKFGSYVGNGSSDGTFVYTGFKPAFLLYKNSTAGATNWQIFDNKRSPYNLSVNRLNPNDSSAELATTADSFDFLSNGFKARATASNSNTSGATYIYMAFAENPFTSSTGTPVTAR
jgi:hypothetical protein